MLDAAPKKTGITRYSFPSTNRKLGRKAWVALWLKATADLGPVKVCGFRYSWVNVCKIPATTLNVAHCPFGFLKATIVCWSWTSMGRSGLLWGGGCDKGSCIGRIVLFVCELQRHANEWTLKDTRRLLFSWMSGRISLAKRVSGHVGSSPH
jgi:hypothetical protein